MHHSTPQPRIQRKPFTLLFLSLFYAILATACAVPTAVSKQANQGLPGHPLTELEQTAVGHLFQWLAETGQAWLPTRPTKIPRRQKNGLEGQCAHTLQSLIKLGPQWFAAMPTRVENNQGYAAAAGLDHNQKPFLLVTPLLVKLALSAPRHLLSYLVENWAHTDDSLPIHGDNVVNQPCLEQPDIFLSGYRDVMARTAFLEATLGNQAIPNEPRGSTSTLLLENQKEMLATAAKVLHASHSSLLNAQRWNHGKKRIGQAYGPPLHTLQILSQVNQLLSTESGQEQVKKAVFLSFQKEIRDLRADADHYFALASTFDPSTRKLSTAVNFSEVVHFIQRLDVVVGWFSGADPETVQKTFSTLPAYTGFEAEVDTHLKYFVNVGPIFMRNLQQARDQWFADMWAETAEPGFAEFEQWLANRLVQQFRDPTDQDRVDIQQRVETLSDALNQIRKGNPARPRL